MLVSADRLTDNRTGNSYYTALVSVDQSDLEALPNVRLYPGMPATVMFPTVERTAFNYVIRPARDVIQSSVPNRWKTQSQIALQDEMIGGSARQRIT